MCSTTNAVSTQVATFAMRCFWRPQHLFDKTRGVVRTTVGFTGGLKPNPEYMHLGDHSEAVEIEFDPTVISYSELLALFWRNHDPTVRPSKIQYRSAIFTHSKEQHRLAMDSLRDQCRTRRGLGVAVTTTVHQAAVFTPADEHHQKYIEKANARAKACKTQRKDSCKGA